MSSISQLLSQHGMLTSLCGNLSSADIIHLAATSKEHWTYIKESTEIYRQLQSTAICDGRGIVAREKLFFGRKVADEGKWDQDDCLGVDAKPCSDCGAIVCNNCRFHFMYRCHEPEGGDIDDEEYYYMERELAEDIIEDEMLLDKTALSTIQGRKAIDIFWYHREREYCFSCHPLLLPERNEYDICRCSFFDHFVGERWLCIPCFIKEEVRALTTPGPKTWAQESELRGMDWEEVKCDCGTLLYRESVQVCMICNKGCGWPAKEMDGPILEKVLEQLGYQKEKPENLRGLLEQLG